MRIIAGKARGRRLKSPSTKAIRPTGDRVREALFSILGDLSDAVIVDAFAGSGALGLEALSRGAAKAYFFDTSHEAIATIHENVERVGVGSQAVVKRCRFVDGLQRVVEEEPDLWFLDPPYHSPAGAEALEAMRAAQSTVTPGALVVWESAREEDLPTMEGFAIEDERVYGAVKLTFLRRLATDVADDE